MSQVPASVDNTRDFDALLNGSKEDHVIPDAETTATRHAVPKTFLPHLRVACEQVAFLANGLNSTQGGCGLVSRDIFRDVH
jgi:hypothetical protein